MSIDSSDMHLTPKLYMVGKGDLGEGGAKFTYQLFGGFEYQVSKSIALVGGYRAIHVNYDRNNFLFDTTCTVIFGLTFAGKKRLGPFFLNGDTATNIRRIALA